MTMPERLIDDVVRKAGLAVLESGREMDEWDQAPFIVLVARKDDEPICVPVPLPEGIWYNVNPAYVLKGMTYGVATGGLKLQLGEPLTTADVCGLMLFTEGHGVDDGDLTDAEKATLDDFRKNHRLEEHPKAREVRMAHIIDRSLTQAMIQHFRGHDVSDRVIYTVTGRIPTAVDRLATALFTSWTAEAEKAN